MVKIAYLILCHDAVDDVLAKARCFLDAGDCVALHMDRRMPESEAARLRAGLRGRPGALFTVRRKCGWGAWSLVRASLDLLRAARAAFPDVTHFMLISADCFPIRSAAAMRRALAEDPRDHVEHKDFHRSDWIKTGMKAERLIYRHWFNERAQPRRFYANLAVQRRLGLRRATPPGLTMRIGSQWWLLRASTVDLLLARLKAAPGLERFFATTWIPDETFFQTLIPALVPAREINDAPPTLLMFSDYGMPVALCADHESQLLGQTRFFARKITRHDPAFRARLLAHYRDGPAEEPARDSGMLARLRYLAARGRHGNRAAPRFWDTGGRVGGTDDPVMPRLTVICCKKWHVGAATAARIAAARGAVSLGYPFDDAPALDLDLGGYEHGLDKRRRAPAAFLAMAAAALRTDRLVLCVDPARRDLLRLLDDRVGSLRVREIRTDCDEPWLHGHAARLGYGALTPDLATALRVEIKQESAALATLGLADFAVLDMSAAETAATAHGKPEDPAAPDAAPPNLSVVACTPPRPMRRSREGAPPKKKHSPKPRPPRWTARAPGAIDSADSVSPATG